MSSTIKTYEIIRFYFNKGNRIVKTGLTLEEAQEHCSDPETCSRTCSTLDSLSVLDRTSDWFDGYQEE